MSDPKPAALVPAAADRAAGNELVAVNGAAEPPPEGGDRLPSIGTLLRAWKRRWLLATTLGLLIAAGVGPAVWYLTPIRYTVFTLLRVVTNEPTVLSSDKGVGGGDPTGLFRQTQVALVVSRPTTLAALRQERVRRLSVVAEQEDPAAWLERQLLVGFLDNTEVLRIAMVGDRPEELSVIVSAVEQTYLQEVVKAEQRQRLMRLEDIGKILANHEEQLRDRKQKLRGMAEAMRTTDTQALTARQKLILEESGALTRELIGVRAEARQRAGSIAVLENHLKTVASTKFTEAEINDILDDDRVVRATVAKVHFEEDVYESVRERAVVGSRHLRDAERAVKDAMGELEKVRASRREAAVARLRARMLTHLRTRLGDARERLAVLQNHMQELKDEVQKKNDEADAIGKTSIELDLKRGEVEQLDAVVRKLRAEKGHLEVEIQSSARRIFSLSSDGEVYTQKNTRSRAAAAGMGAALTFLFVGLSVAAWDFSRRRIHCSEDVSRQLGLRVLATLPRAPGASLRGPAGSAGAQAARSVWEEGLCGLRTALFLSEEGPPAVLMVTSAGPREGKTTLAAHLAVSIAATGRRTLLVDCDLRRPVLHQVFSAEPGPGVCEVLRGEADIAAALQPTPMPGLSLLPAGRPCRQALTALVRENARALFEALKGRFDCVVVDTSPVLAVSDALLIGRYADGVLLAVRSRVSRTPKVRAAYERLKLLNKRFLAAVVNGAPDELDAEEYRYVTSS